MGRTHEGSTGGWLTHDCKNCGESKILYYTGQALHHDIEPHLCDACKQAEKRDEKINALLGDAEKKWYEFWK